MKNPVVLVIGDKNLSSWSMRPWLALKAAGVPFKEIKIRLDTPQTHKQILKYSPTGRVPALIHGKTTVWDSLAICEYIAEVAPERNLWPQKAEDRAIARSMVAEMHSGFSGLRSQMSMDIKLRLKLNHLTPQTVADVKRVLHLWQQALQKSSGPFLFGEDFGIADAFYAPVVMRFRSYGIEVKNPICQTYIKTISNYKAVRQWVSGASKETAIRPRF